MEMTTKQIADMLGVDKQKVYRYIKKNHISEAHQENGAKHYSEAVQKQIKQVFEESEAHQKHVNEAHQKHINDTVSEAVIEVLKNQLEAKDRQIAEMQKLLDQEQQLRMAEHQKLLLLDKQEEEKPTGFFKKLFGKSE